MFIKTIHISFILIIFMGLLDVHQSISATKSDIKQKQENELGKLAVLWTSGDPDVAHKVCFMYTRAAKKNKWFGEVKLIVWGPSARLLAGDKELQAKVKAMMNDGISVEACVACANMYGVAEQLRQLGVDVKPMGKPLTKILKTDWKLLTF